MSGAEEAKGNCAKAEAITRRANPIISHLENEYMLAFPIAPAGGWYGEAAGAAGGGKGACMG